MTLTAERTRVFIISAATVSMKSRTTSHVMTSIIPAPSRQENRPTIQLSYSFPLQPLRCQRTLAHHRCPAESTELRAPLVSPTRLHHHTRLKVLRSARRRSRPHARPPAHLSRLRYCRHKCLRQRLRSDTAAPRR